MAFLRPIWHVCLLVVFFNSHPVLRQGDVHDHHKRPWIGHPRRRVVGEVQSTRIPEVPSRAFHQPRPHFRSANLPLLADQRDEPGAQPGLAALYGLNGRALHHRSFGKNLD